MWICGPNSHTTTVESAFGEPAFEDNTSETTSESPVRLYGSLIRVLRLAVILLTAGVLLSGCQGCGKVSLAKLADFKGITERDHGASQNQWHPAHKGDLFYLNDGVRTRAATTAELWLNDGSGLKMQPNSMVRFSKTRPDQNEVGLRIEAGVIIIDAVSDGLQINTQYGVAILEKGTQVRLTRGKDGIVMDVQIGKARFLADDEKEVLLGEGQRLQITMGKAVLIAEDDTDDSDANSADSEGTDDSAALEMTAESAAVTGIDQGGDSGLLIREPQQSSPHLAIQAGGTVFIHSFSVPVNVSIRFADTCPNGGAVKLIGRRQRYSGEAQSVLPLMMGRNRYQVYCADESGVFQKSASARGLLHVVRDTGKVRLALTPPLSTILMDGRTYNVNYQTRLPAIRAKWPSPPESKKYTLFVSGKNPQQIVLRQPTHLFEAGTLSEGVHTFKFIDDSSGIRSRSTRLKIQFDNAADKAVLTEPREGEFASGALVQVSGTAMPGWKVSAPGGEIAMDAAGRFGGSLRQNPDYKALWIVLSHPQRGVHYYLRRCATSSP